MRPPPAFLGSALSSPALGSAGCRPLRLSRVLSEMLPTHFVGGPQRKPTRTMCFLSGSALSHTQSGSAPSAGTCPALSFSAMLWASAPGAQPSIALLGLHALVEYPEGCNYVGTMEVALHLLHEDRPSSADQICAKAWQRLRLHIRETWSDL